MRRFIGRLVVPPLVFVGLLALVWTWQHRGRGESGTHATRSEATANHASDGVETNSVSLGKWRPLSPTLKTKLLELLGRIPDEADSVDVLLAQKTSWWGKRIDPKAFWHNRTVWLDRSACQEAMRHGRSYPPIPFDDPAVAGLDDTDSGGNGFEIEGPNISYVSSYRERAFWDRFVKTHPHPPDDITAWAEGQAASWLRYRQMPKDDPEMAARLELTPERLNWMIEASTREAATFGYPVECLTPEAYYWIHVSKKREEYNALMADGHTDHIRMTNFFMSVHVDVEHVTGTLSTAEAQLAREWKCAYVRRLRREHADESYISAYLSAWRLSSNQVWGQVQ